MLTKWPIHYIVHYVGSGERFQTQPLIFLPDLLPARAAAAAPTAAAAAHHSQHAATQLDQDEQGDAMVDRHMSIRER